MLYTTRAVHTAHTLHILIHSLPMGAHLLHTSSYIYEPEILFIVQILFEEPYIALSVIENRHEIDGITSAYMTANKQNDDAICYSHVRPGVLSEDALRHVNIFVNCDIKLASLTFSWFLAVECTLGCEKLYPPLSENNGRFLLNGAHVIEMKFTPWIAHHARKRRVNFN